MTTGTIKPRSKLPTRVPLAEVCRVLGISVDTYERRWAGTFTDYRDDARRRFVAEDELKEAARHTDPAAARAAVKQKRAEWQRL